MTRFRLSNNFKIIIILGTIYLTENDELVKTYKRQHNI